jgi:hypothetical protein
MSHQGQQTLTAKDVVFVEGFERSASLFKNDATLRIKDLLAKIEAICLKSGELSSEEIAILFGNGIGCEVLRPGAEDWQTGNLNLSLQFRAGAVAALPTIDAVTPAATNSVVAHGAAPAVVAPAVVAPAVVAPAVVAPVAVAPEPAVVPVEMPSTHQNLNAFADSSTGVGFADFGADLGADLGAADLGAAVFGGDRGSDRGSGLGDNFGDDFGLEAAAPSGGDLEVPAAENEFDADLMGLMDDAAPAASDFSGLDDLDGFDLDSTAAPASAVEDLSSPWDLSDDLDSMLMAN